MNDRVMDGSCPEGFFDGASKHLVIPCPGDTMNYIEWRAMSEAVVAGSIGVEGASGFDAGLARSRADQT